MKGSKTNRIEYFSAFRSGMLSYFSLYPSKEEKVKKTTTSHRLAVEFSKYFPEDTKIELDYNGADIFILSKNNDPLISILWSKDYLGENDKKRANELHKKYHPVLTLAFSLLNEKDYILVYRFEKDFLEYLHISKIDFSESVLKKIELENKNVNKREKLLFSLKNPKNKN